MLLLPIDRKFSTYVSIIASSLGVPLSHVLKMALYYSKKKKDPEGTSIDYATAIASIFYHGKVIRENRYELAYILRKIIPLIREPKYFPVKTVPRIATRELKKEDMPRIKSGLEKLCDHAEEIRENPFLHYHFANIYDASIMPFVIQKAYSAPFNSLRVAYTTQLILWALAKKVFLFITIPQWARRAVESLIAFTKR